MAYLKRLQLLVLGFLWVFTATSQEPTAKATTKRINDTTLQLQISVALPKGFQLFSVNNSQKEASFISSIVLNDSSYNQPVVFAEEGKAITIKEQDNIEYQTFSDSITYTATLTTNKTFPSAIKGSLNWLAKLKDEYLNNSVSFSAAVPTATDLGTTANKLAEGNLSLWNTFFLTLLAGLLAIFTPCVFPLIPVTVSFFLKRSANKALGIRNAVFYSLSIIAIYTIPTLILTWIFGDSFLYDLATSAGFNLLFFVVFLVFAISFFGAFEISLPNSWANKADEKAGKGGLIGIFFMALTLVIVSFSCTGPIVGTLLGETSAKGITLAPIIGMLGFGVGLALPFSLFAFFPGMLQTLPKSGGWLNAVKVTFGFVELALALKFLSNVDLIYHWHILDRDIFLSFWIVIALLAGWYVLGKLPFSHDSPVKFISIPRLFFAIFFFSMAAYMIPGLWGAPLKLLSGVIPPATTQEFNLESLRYQNNSGFINQNKQLASPPKKYTDILKVPFGLTAYFDLEEGIAAAKIVNKPIMLDFTGHSCANCRKMEE
ncbi:MAG: protein-disulfide reductase DsbD family protein, partial [Chitinophagaceae bacterium]